MPDTSSPASCPYLFCDDLERQIAFLERAFGLSAARVDRDPDGHVQHAQLVLGAAKVMLGGVGTYEGYRPRKSPEALGAAGAKILMEPADMHWGDRLYCAEDPEGQFWMFATPKG